MKSIEKVDNIDFVVVPTVLTDEGLSETEMELLKSAYKEVLLIKDGKLKGIPVSELWND